METAQDASGGRWRAYAQDVRGPGSRGRGTRPDGGGPREFASLGHQGDQGDLWIEDGSLYFAGRAEAWSIPLGWLNLPETDLAGVTHLSMRTADRLRDVAMRFSGVDDERGLANAIKESRLAEPDARDRRALQDLLALIMPQLQSLDTATPAPESGAIPPAAAEQCASQAFAAANRLRSTWLPYWGGPAGRLRDATIGALVATGEASIPNAGSAAMQRHEQAVRRWRNVCEDLHEWCGLPERPEALTAPRLPGAAAAPAAPVSAAPEERPAGAAVEAEAPPEPKTEPELELESEPEPGPEPEPEDEDATLIVGVPPSLRSAKSKEGMPASAPSPIRANVAATAPDPGRKGSGGMTLLFRREGAGGSFARKVLQPEGVQTADVAETFLRIGARFAAVHHPNLVRILGSGRGDDGAPYIDMEFVDSEPINVQLKRGPLPREQALAVVEQIAGAIDAIHQAGLIHGDIRPQNILLNRGGRALVLEASVAADFILEQRRGTIYGDLPYLTPERVRGEPSDARSDVYVLATLAFALLAGRPPFEGEAEDIFAGHVEQQPPSLNSIAPDMPASASAVIDHALAKVAAERPATAGEFSTALRQAFAGTAQSRPAPGPLAERTDSIERQRPPPSAAPLPLSGPSALSPLGRSAPSPLGGVAPASGDEEEPPDDLDKTIIVRPRR